MPETTTLQSVLAQHAVRVDHIAIAVPDLETSVAFYRDVLGFDVAERRTTRGNRTAMVSAVLQAGPITVVLVQGTSAESQVSRYVEHYGPGVQHIALEVEDLPELTRKLEESGLEFDTTIIQGTGIRQSFTHRDAGSGMMFELIERQEEDGHFTDESVEQLFRQLEASDAY
jgi:methylmalonyl-CoA/ethylmalonyl-CoA epimerase